MTETAVAPALTALDRCDRCGAQAYVKAILPTKSDLLFCAHHAGEHGDKIKQIPGVEILDETSKLAVK